jgi:hypothetical protein
LFVAATSGAVLWLEKTLKLNELVTAGWPQSRTIASFNVIPVHSNHGSNKPVAVSMLAAFNSEFPQVTAVSYEKSIEENFYALIKNHAPLPVP